MSPDGPATRRKDALLRPVAAWPRLAGSFAAAVGILVLAGWALDVATLKAPLPGFPSMKANTALCFLLIGTAVLLRDAAGWRARAGQVAATVALAVGTLTLIEYLAGVDLGIDEALVRDDLATIATSSPGRMSALTAMSFTLCGAGVLAAHRPGSGMVREAFGAAVLALATFVLGSYAYGAPLVSTYTQVALHTAATFLLLGPAIILARDDGPLAGLLRSPDIDGQLARRLFPAAVAVPLLVGFVRIQLQDQGLVDTSTGAALFAALMTVALATVATLALARLQEASRRTNEALAAEREALARLRLASAELEAFFARNLDMMAIVGFDGRFREMNPAWQTTLGHPLADMLGRPFLDFVHPDDVERTRAEAGRLSATGQPLPFENRYRRADGTYAWLRWTSNTSNDLQVFLATARDITQEREAQRALREAEQRTQESEARLRTIFANSPVGIILTRPDGTVLDLNPAAETLWGRTRAEFLDPSFRMERLYADPQERAEMAQRLQREGRARDVEVRMVRGDGQVRHMSFNASALQLAGETVFLAAGQDITPLRQSEERFRTLFLTNPVAMALSRADGSGLLDVNPAYETLLGHTREHMLAPGFDPATLWAHPEQRQRVLQEIRAKGGADGLTLEFRRSDGVVRSVLLSARPLEVGGQAVLLSALQDVTEARAADAAARRAQERFEQVFRASPVAICLSREDGRVLDANDAFCALVGRSIEDLTAGQLQGQALWDDPEERQRMILALRQGGVVRDLDLRVRRPDGEVRTTLASIEFIDLGGGTTILSMLQDVTDRLRVQRELEERRADEAELERLRRTDRFRTEFINSTAHELATPLTPVVLALRGLAADAHLSAQQKKAVEILERNVARLRRLVDEMLGAADLQARTMALDRRRLNLTRELRAAVAAHHPAAMRAGVAMDEPEDTGLTVSADPARLQLVLGHLLGNAIKFTPAGGRVTVTNRRVGDDVRIEVTDSGVGLTSKQMELLWRPFGQAHDKSQRTDSGSGLGLYVVKGIVELHGGEVGCSSPGPGKGATFWFTLPLATGHLDPLARPKPAPEAPQEPRRNLNPGVADP